MKQRIRDWLREKAIRRLARELTAAMQAKQWNAAAELEKRFQEAHAQRSPGQVARIARAKFNRLDPHAQMVFLDAGGIPPKTVIKQGLMRAFLRGLVPAWAVRVAFRVFGLRSA